MPEGLPDDVAQHVDHVDDERIHLSEIENVSFPIRMRGYDRDEVDALLAQLAIQARHLLEVQAQLEHDNEAPYLRLGNVAGNILQLARDNADQMTSEGLAQVAAERAAAESDIEELRRRAETEASALKELAERDATAVRKEADRLLAEARVQATAKVLEAETEAADIRQAHQHIRAETEAEVRALKAEVEDEVKQLKAKAHADYTVMTREAHRDANRVEKEARQRAELLKDEAEAQAAEHVRKARAEVVKLREAEAALQKRVGALQSTLDTLSQDVGKEDVEAGAGSGTETSPVDLTDSRRGPS